MPEHVADKNKCNDLLELHDIASIIAKRVYRTHKKLFILKGWTWEDLASEIWIFASKTLILPCDRPIVYRCCMQDAIDCTKVPMKDRNVLVSLSEPRGRDEAGNSMRLEDIVSNPAACNPEVRGLISEKIQSLPRKVSQCFILRQQGFSQREIAARLNVCQQTISKWLRKYFITRA
jgi:DNA-binding transcriptional regulator YiaG